MKPDQQAEIVRRLHCAAGHLNAVIEMAENGQPCEKVLHQLNAIEAALQAAGFKLLMLQTHQSEAMILSSSSPIQRAAELKRLQSLYSILIQKPDVYNEVIK
jgi:DNA-binding FrmR family transcriptional regulator